MDLRKTGRRLILVLLLAAVCLALSGCRTRIAPEEAGSRNADGESSVSGKYTPASEENRQTEEAADAPDPDGAVSEKTVVDPESDRREFDETAPVEIEAGLDRLLHAEGEGNGTPGAADEGGAHVSRVQEEAEETATQTVPAENADQMGVDDEAEAADSSMTYFTVLIQDRMRSLFECQRANVYWETDEPYRTIYKTSPEHALILAAGAYDVSARLLEENLTVDDGWVARKQPDVIVKVVGSDILGRHAAGTGAAKRTYEALLRREGWAGIPAVLKKRVLLLSREMLEAPYMQVAAMLALDKIFRPDLFEDVDLDEAIRMLTEEATGTVPTGVMYYPPLP